MNRVHIIDLIDTAEALREALAAAARLLSKCRCQYERESEAKAAIELSTVALDKMDDLSERILNDLLKLQGRKVQ